MDFMNYIPVSNGIHITPVIQRDLKDLKQVTIKLQYT